MLSYKLGLLSSLQSPVSSERVCSGDTVSGELAQLSQSQLGATTPGEICTASKWKHVLEAFCVQFVCSFILGEWGRGVAWSGEQRRRFFF